MAITSGFFNGIDRKYDAIQIAAMFDGLITDGVFSNVAKQFEIKATTGNTITVGTGRAWFDRTWTYNDALIQFTLDAAEPLLNRFDAMVLEMNKTNRENVIKYLKGTPSSIPIEPTYVNNSQIHQVPLGVIYRQAGTTMVTQADISPKVGTSKCPLVTAVNQSMTIDAIVAKWGAEFSLWTDAEKAEFTTWFDLIKGQLATDPAGNLQNQINAINSIIGSDVVLKHASPIEHVSGSESAVITVPAGLKFIPAEGLNTDGTVKRNIMTLNAQKQIGIQKPLSPKTMESYSLYIDHEYNLKAVKNVNYHVVDMVEEIPEDGTGVYYVVTKGLYYDQDGLPPVYGPVKYCYLASFIVNYKNSLVYITSFRVRNQEGLNKNIRTGDLVHSLSDIDPISGNNKIVLNNHDMVPSMHALSEIKNWSIFCETKDGMDYEKFANGKAEVAGSVTMTVDFPYPLGTTGEYYQVLTLTGPKNFFKGPRPKMWVNAYSNGLPVSCRAKYLGDAGISITIKQFGNEPRVHDIDWFIKGSWRDTGLNT